MRLSGGEPCRQRELAKAKLLGLRVLACTQKSKGASVTGQNEQWGNNKYAIRRRKCGAL